MNNSRPIDPGIVAFALAWFAGAIVVCACLLYIATRGQSAAGKLLYMIGAICLLAVPASVSIRFALSGWYGGRPDPVASTSGSYYVREKHRLTPVSKDEFQRLQKMRRDENWFLGPCAVGIACLGVGRLLRPRDRVVSDRGRDNH